MKVTVLTRRWLRLNNIVFVLLLLVIVALLAWLSTRYDYQADWTASGRNTLSSVSVTVLEKMSGPVTITAFAREAGMLRRHINVLVNRYQRHKDDLTLQFVNPDLEPERIRALNITVDGEMLIEYQGRSEQLRDLSEQGLSNGLQRLMRSGQRRFVFVQGHGERAPGGNASYDLGYWTAQMEAKGIDIDTINLARDGAVAAMSSSVMVVASPRSDFLPAEVVIIQDYIKLGGQLLWLVDPGSLHGLEPLAEQLQLQFRPGLIMDPNISQVGQMMFGTDDPRITLVANYPDHPLVDGFSFNTLFPMSQSVTLKGTGEWQGAVFLRSMSNTWQETGQQTGQVVFDDDDIAGPLSLGLTLSRNLDQATATDAQGGGEIEGEADANDSSEQRIVVIGDGDFLSNGFLGLGGNLQLAMNIVNWLSRDDLLLAVPVNVATDSSLQLSEMAVLFIGLGFLVLLPALLLACGLLIWWRRRQY